MGRRGGRSAAIDAEIAGKIARLKSGGKPRVLDLFSGCGGLSLGFQAAGCSIEAALELDPISAQTHAQNFHSHLPPEQLAKHAKARDIVETEPDDLTGELGLGRAALAFDVVVGGPPCQAYARVGRAKLREVAEHPNAFKVDARGNLYLRYLHFVKGTKPLAILMENVPDALNYGGHNVMAEVAEVLSSLGYVVRYSLINAAFHGIPQMRDRVFLIGLHKSLGTDVCFPTPTNHMKLPSGYGGTRAVALKLIDLFSAQNFVEADHGNKSLPGPVSCEDAIGDLPPITLHLEGKLKRGARRLDQFVPYPRPRRLSAYAHHMRNWPGFESQSGIWDHALRYLPRDTEIFREMPNGGEYPAAHATASAIWLRKVAEAEDRKGRPLPQAEKDKLHRAIVPPYPLGSFPNRWWKLRRDWPARTLMAHIGKDTYSHIHYDSAQARVISVREAARLQSFPDGFRFCGTMNPAFRQIGNAVPPLISKRLAESILTSIGAAVTSPGRTAASRRRVKYPVAVAAE